MRDYLARIDELLNKQAKKLDDFEEKIINNLNSKQGHFDEVKPQDLKKGDRGIIMTPEFKKVTEMPLICLLIPLWRKSF